MTVIKKVLSGFLLLTILTSSGLSQIDKSKKRGMHFDREIIELGDIEYGKIKSHKMFYLNNTKKPLIINDITSSTPSLSAIWEEIEVLPGDSAEIKISQHAKKEGRFSNTIIIHSKAKNSPVRLVLTGITSKAPAHVKGKINYGKANEIGEEFELSNDKNSKNRVIKKVKTSRERFKSINKRKRIIKK